MIVIDVFKESYGTCPVARLQDEPRTKGKNFVKSWEAMSNAEFFGKRAWDDWCSLVGGFSPGVQQIRKDLGHK